ncbi:uncharacterized protein LOC144422898 [Styela clava]
MTPEYTDDVITGNQISGHVTTSSPHKHYRRGKTGRQRKKRKHWGLFSRWRTQGDSDDENDIELYQWSKSRGLTSRNHSFSSETTKSAPVQNRTKALNAVSHSKTIHRSSSTHNVSTSGKNQPTENSRRIPSADATATAAQERIFLAKLCSSIDDKKLFIERSQNPRIEGNDKPKKITTEQSSPNPPKSNYSVRLETRCVKSARIDSTKPDRKFQSPTKEIVEPKIESNERKNFTQSKSTATMENITYDVNGRRVVQKPGKSGEGTTSPTMLKKEWSAKVESDILHLYESGCYTSSTNVGTSLVSSWATPGTHKKDGRQSAYDLTTDISHSIDKKLENTEQTPSYVQSLAIMLKCRIKLRKEREQILEHNMKKMERLQVGTNKSQNSDKREIISSDSTSTVEMSHKAPSSSAHLRYRHIDDNLPGSVGGSQFQTEDKRFSPTYSLASQSSSLRPLHDVSFKTNSADFSDTYSNENRSSWNSPQLNRLERKQSNVKPHFNSRAISPKSSKVGQNQMRLPDFTWDNAAPGTIKKQVRSQLWDDDEFDNSEMIISTITKRLEKEARACADDTRACRLGSGNEHHATKLQKPTPMLYYMESTRNPVQTVSKKARMCLESNSRLKTNFTDERIVKQRNADLNSISKTDLKSVRVGNQVHWPASTGSLYLRPPGKTVLKAPVQKA